MECRIGHIPGEKMTDIKGLVEHTVQKAAQKDPWLREHSPVVEWFGWQTEPWYQNPDHPFVKTFKRVAEEVLGHEVEYIGCGTRNLVFPGIPPFQFAFCQAADAADTQVFCSTQNVDLVKAVDAISDSSFITFSFDSFGECTAIGVSTQSLHLRGGKESK